MSGTETFRGRLLDLEYEISCSDADLCEYVRRALRDSRHEREPVVPDGPHPRRVRFSLDRVGGSLELTVDDECVATGAGRWVVSNLFFQINRRTVDACADDVVLHAAAVERRGQAIVIAGPSGAGKSVSSVGLARRGGRLLTDDVLKLRPDGDVEGSRKPIGLRAGAFGVLGIDPIEAERPDELGADETVQVPASALGVAYGRPSRPALVVFVDGQSDVDSVRPLSKPDCLTRLCDLAFSLVPTPRVDSSIWDGW